MYRQVTVEQNDFSEARNFSEPLTLMYYGFKRINVTESNVITISKMNYARPKRKL